jgi:FixJ family two-component response regulator
MRLIVPRLHHRVTLQCENATDGRAGNHGGLLARSRASAMRKVLVAEDDESIREAIERLLHAAGFGSMAYTSAEALLAGGAGSSADCVVSDLRLPAMSGLELLAELRARGWGGPLILITAYDAPGRREEAMRCGAAAYLVKPFRGTELLAAVRTAIEPMEAS